MKRILKSMWFWIFAIIISISVYVYASWHEIKKDGSFIIWLKLKFNMTLTDAEVQTQTDALAVWQAANP